MYIKTHSASEKRDSMARNTEVEGRFLIVFSVFNLCMMYIPYLVRHLLLNSTPVQLST